MIKYNGKDSEKEFMNIVICVCIYIERDRYRWNWITLLLCPTLETQHCKSITSIKKFCLMFKRVKSNKNFKKKKVTVETLD